MTKPNNLINQRFHMLEVIERVENDKNGKTMWLCKCDCGNEIIVRGQELIRKQSTSCGCVKKMISRIVYLSRNPNLTWIDENFYIEKIVCDENRKNIFARCLKCNFEKQTRTSRINILKNHKCTGVFK